MTKNKTLLDVLVNNAAAQIRKTFLKEWSIDQFIIVEKAISKHFVSTGINVTNTKTRHLIPNLRDLKQRFENIDNVLGLAYTSSSSYAGYWVCNVEAQNDKYPGYHYTGFAMGAGNKVYAVLDDKDENEIILPL